MNRLFVKGESDSKPSYELGSTSRRWTNFLKPKSKETIDLIETFDIENDFANFKQQKLNHFRPEVLYQQNSFDWFGRQHKYITRCTEDAFCVGEGSNQIIPVLSQETCRKVAKTHRYMHIGMIMVGLKGLHMKHLGTKAMIVIYDDSMPIVEKKPMVFAECDLTLNRGLFYCAPDLLIETKDVSSIKIGVQTKGYSTITRNNLSITVGLLSKSAKSTNINYRCNVKNVIEGLASKGVQFIKAEGFDANIFNGQSWKLKEMLTPPEMVCEPTTGIIFNDGDDLDICFGKYKGKAPIQETNFDSEDES